MKILITNNHLNTIGGSETWVWTVRDVLRRKGFKVDVFTLNPGIEDVYTPQRLPKEKYDLVLCNHNSCFFFIKDFVRHKKMTFISHGTAHSLESPCKGADRYVSISEEVRSRQLYLTEIDSEVILNPIDLQKFYPESNPNKPPKIALGLFQGEKALSRISEIDLIFYVTPQSRHERIKITNQRFNCVDVVFSLGRGAYEGLATGRPVIVYDSRPYQDEFYDGLITKENIDQLLSFNCSGRATKSEFNPDRVKAELTQIQEADYYRSIAEKYFDADQICEKLIQ